MSGALLVESFLSSAVAKCHKTFTSLLWRQKSVLIGVNPWFVNFLCVLFTSVFQIPSSRQSWTE